MQGLIRPDTPEQLQDAIGALANIQAGYSNSNRNTAGNTTSPNSIFSALNSIQQQSLQSPTPMKPVIGPLNGLNLMPITPLAQLLDTQQVDNPTLGMEGLSLRGDSNGVTPVNESNSTSPSLSPTSPPKMRTDFNQIMKSKSNPVRTSYRNFFDPLVSPYKGEDKINLGGMSSKKVVKKTLFESADTET